MKYLKILLFFITLLSFSKLFAGEHLQATIKKSGNNCVDIYAKPDIVMNAVPLGYVISVRWPTQSESVTASISNLLAGMAADPLAQHSSGGYTYQDFNINQSGTPPAVNWTANNEYKIATICFGGNSSELSHIQQVDEDGGANGWVYWYFQFEGSLDDVTNYTNPFYASLGYSTADNSGEPQYAETIDDISLAISIANFSATKYNSSSSYLSWTSMNEVNFDKFEVERSIDSRNWSKIGEVKGYAFSKTNDYSYIDKDVYSGNGEQTFYYRLKMIDKDGGWRYSKVENVIFSPSEKDMELTLFPNPSSGKVYFTLSGIKTDSKVDITIYDNTGKMVYRKDMERLSKSNLLLDNYRMNMDSGVYNVLITDDKGNRFYKKLIITK